MQMTNSEIVRRYKAADDRRKMIRILAELNACPKEEIRKILREAGFDVPATGNRYTAAKKEAEETEASGSKRKQAKLTEKGRRLLKNEESTECSDLSAPGARTAEPVDVWGRVIALSEYDEDTIRYAERELRILNDLIEAMEKDLNQRKLEIQANKCKAEYFRLWLRNTKGGTEG